MREAYLQCEWVPRDDIQPNDWNPNRMDAETQDRLLRSIRDNGWTRPIVVHETERYIIDGEQRWQVAGREAVRVDETLTPDGVPAGHVPVFGITVSDAQARLGTIQHNRATGEQEADRLKDFIAQMEDRDLIPELEHAVGFDRDGVDLTVIEDIPDEDRDDDTVFTQEQPDDTTTEALDVDRDELVVIEFALTLAEFDSVFDSMEGVADTIVETVTTVDAETLVDVCGYEPAEADAIVAELADE